MKRTLILDTLKAVGESVTIKGWVHVRRDHGKIVFLDIRDRSGMIQVVGSEVTKDARPQSVVYITGTVQKRPDRLVNPNLPTGTVELSLQSIEVVSKAEELPLDMGAADLNLELPTMLDYRALTLRHPKQAAIFKIQAVIIDAFRRFLQEQDFTEFQSPNIISSAPEGGAEVFSLDYFGHQAFLSQSPQLYKSLLVSIYERVFSVNKVFRAEPSVTTRHLTEVVSLDAEMGFIEDYLEVMDMAESTIKFILAEVEKHCGPELTLLEATLPQVSDQLPRLKLTEALEIIYQRTGRDHRSEKDLDPEDEREICRYALEEFGSDLIFISHYYTKKKPFYTYADPENPEFNQGFDLLGRGVEWMTGGRRVHDYQEIQTRIKDWGMDPGKIELYLQSLRFGMPPLGGFAFGAERITMHLLQLPNIRLASLFPRDMERIDSRLSNQS
ncbi:aspartate--tRNA(Asn) ligase [Candidatus Collierbacteria bacterium RIFOXYB1_FULL_49_13]|uniref:Aspartate--tRNA ligase n=1 Tax=Candidatus Collierbacteria bacterium RIFOXYB1_FULL_49_13 TaxID=1817728 RepID=A0A1F5FF12_9BACT|nr:MAG: aspartate--tRNA(Asn) ligase [Candidatus Collierbacteria bacterium RIFOXYB1_FULL_49_13]